MIIRSTSKTVVKGYSTENKHMGRGGQEVGQKGNRLAGKYCADCRLAHDVSGITRSLITLN